MTPPVIPNRPRLSALSFDRPMSAERMFDVVIVAEPEGGYSVFVPELPSVTTQGETIEEARANAQEAIEGYLEVMHEDGLPIPSVHRDRVAGPRRVSQTPAVTGKQQPRSGQRVRQRWSCAGTLVHVVCPGLRCASAA
jgi:predicted RNase H-like HicB family nuclease